MNRGKVIHLRKNSIVLLGEMLVQVKSISANRVELYCYGESDIIMPGDVNRLGLSDVKEIKEHFDGMRVDSKDMQRTSEVWLYGSANRRRNDAAGGMARPTGGGEGPDDTDRVQGT